MSTSAKPWYLASPYSLYPGGIDTAHEMVAEQAALLVKRGVPVFSPILTWHFTAKSYGLPTDAASWEPQNRALVSACQGMIELHASNWFISVGMNQEREWFVEANLPIIIMHPFVVPRELLS